MGRAISRALLNYLLLILLVAVISGIGIKDYQFYRADMDFSLLPSAERAVIEANASSVGMDPYDYYMRFVAPKDYPALAMNPLHAGLYTLYHSLFEPDYDYPIPRKLMVVRTLVLILLAEITIILIGFPSQSWSSGKGVSAPPSAFSPGSSTASPSGRWRRSSRSSS